MRRTALSLALLLAAPWIVSSASAENLGDIYRLALANDPVYAAARETYKAGQEKLPQARAGLLPNVNATAFARNSDTDSSLGSGTTSTQPYGYGISLVQPIYRKQSLETYEQAKLSVLLAEQELQLALQDLLLRTAQAYFDVLKAQDDVATAQAQKQAFAEQLAQAKRSFEVGAATIVDTYEAQARYDLTTAQEIAALNELEVKRRALEKIINQPAPKLAALAPKVTLTPPTPDSMDAWVRQAQENSLGVIMNQTAEEIARREVDKQRGGYHPNLDLSASYSDSRNTSTTLGGTEVNVKSGVIGLELSWPIYQGGGTDSRVREAVAKLEKARNDLDNARRQAALDARQAYLGVVSGAARVKAYEQALASTELQLKSTKLGLEVGVRTRVDVLNVEQQLYTTQRDLYSSRYQSLIAGLQLKAAAGTLTEDDFKAIDALLK